ncbi:MAG: NAD+ synthase [Chloroflexi bacterium]|nr:NAD+ synthase [Chloroflexota bacterium]
MRRLRIALAQINTTVGDFKGNTRKILEAIDEAKSLGADLVTLPELAVCGYPPEDLLFKTQFIRANRKALDQVISHATGITAVVGFVDTGDGLYNAAAIIHDGELIDIYHKTFLPNYGVFDENRYFQAGSLVPVYIINGVGVGINICEDIWYEMGPTSAQVCYGAEVIINISASPYHTGRGKEREDMLKTRAVDNLTFIAYNNLVGGQDELIFDGNSVVIDVRGNLIARGKQFEEDLIVVEFDADIVAQARDDDPGWKRKRVAVAKQDYQTATFTITEAAPANPKPALPMRQCPVYEPEEEIYHALVLGTHDYVTKNGFKKVLIGLSGGIDSSLVATIAVDALGKANVAGVAMPSEYSSPGSISDAERLAQNLGIQLTVIPINEVFQSYLATLAEALAGTEPDVTEENLQARIRGNLLMALSNKFGWLVLTTGNKSEMATGYATLYGDMAGGFAVIKDVPKTLVYRLSRHRNAQAGDDLIPLAVIEKEPSAELRPNQRDSDSLPPYEILDPILTAYVEDDRSIEQIVDMGFDEETIRKAARLVDATEYKRRQSPPGIKITPRAFGRDRRLPITNRYKQ